MSVRGNPQPASPKGLLSSFSMLNPQVSDRTSSAGQIEHGDDERQVRFPPWSLHFRGHDVEAQFTEFTSPPWYGGFAVYAMGLLAGVASQLSDIRTFPDQDGIAKYVAATRPVLPAASAGCFTFYLALFILLHARIISLSRFNRWSLRLRVLYHFIFTFVSVNLAIESRDCGSENHPYSYVVTCIRTVHYNSLTPLNLQFLLPIGFDANVIRLCILPLAEVILSIAPATSKGQPYEGQFSRPVFIAILSCIYGVLYYKHEKQSRDRFLFARRLQELTFRARARKEQVAQVLVSLCGESQLKTLLTGQVLEDSATEATVMITDLDSYTDWRRSWLPRHALSMLGNIYEGLEEARVALRVEKLSYRGDQLITAAGLRSADTDPSRLLVFATKQRLLCSRIAIRLQGRTLRPPMLRWGFGTGPCHGYLVPGSVVYYVAWGPALDDAHHNLSLSTPLTVEVPGKIVDACLEYELSVGPSSRGPAFQVCRGIRTLNSSFQDEAPSSSHRRASASLEGQRGTETASQSRKVFLSDSQPLSQPENGNVSTLVVSAGNYALSVRSGIQRHHGAPELQHSSILDIFRLTQPEGFAQFQEQMAITLRTFSFGIWFGLIGLYLLVLALDEDMNSTYLGLGIAAVAVVGLLLFPGPSMRWRTFFVSFVALLLLSSFSIIRQNSIVTAFVVPRLNIIFVCYLIVSIHVHALLHAAIIILHAVGLLLLSFLHPNRYPFDDLRTALLISVTPLLNFVILVNRARHSRLVFEILTARRSMKEAAAAEKDVHEKVLGMLLPKYVVPLIAKRQEEGQNPVDVVVDTLPDVAVLFLRFQPFATCSEMLRVSKKLDSFIVSTQSSLKVSLLHLIYADGDDYRLGGPLQRDLGGELGSKPATSMVAGRPLKLQILSEIAADAASQELIRVLGTLVAEKVKCLGVLHRGDGYAAVFGTERPTFSLLGPVSETAQELLRSVADQPRAMLATSHFVEPSSRYPSCWSTSGLAAGQSMPFAIKALGTIRAHPLNVV